MTQYSNSTTSTPDEISAYVQALLDILGDRDPFEVLRETPDALRVAVRGMTEAQLSTPEAPGKWSVRQVLAHLADSELVGAFRFRMALAHDAPELPGYDQDAWARALRYENAAIEDALGDFARLRQSNLRVLTRTTPEERKRVIHHAERGDEPLAHLIKLYAGHDLVHRKQVARIRAGVAG
ncbi:MAG TPA: DinB family protein [Gemmatimonadales bacterium]|nr:DinB family protein [Gemmatimonadales bacterium]